MTYEIDPELAALVPGLPDLGYADVAAGRALRHALAAQAPQYQAPVAVQVTDHRVAGDPGVSVPVRIYAPAGRSLPSPAFVFIHGGGFAFGSIEISHGYCLRVAAETGAVVASLDYRLAPEHPFPAGLRDCAAVLGWLHAQAAALELDPTRIAVGGESAGGGLAAALSLIARDEGGPPIRFQLLSIPVLDDRLGTPSAITYVDTPLWNRANATLSWGYYLGGMSGDAVPGTAAPARATDLRGLPPAYLSVCQFDPSRDEAIDYAQRLAQAGVATELRLHPGTFHGCKALTTAVSERMLAAELAALRRGLDIAG